MKQPRLMRRISVLLLLVVFATATSVIASSITATSFTAQEQVLDGASIAEWKERVLPRPKEAGADRIDWRVSFSSGLTDAASEGKPLLLWLMNGHPLGCT